MVDLPCDKAAFMDKDGARTWLGTKGLLSGWCMDSVVPSLLQLSARSLSWTRHTPATLGLF